MRARPSWLAAAPVALALSGLALGLATCEFPSDQSDQIFLTIEAPSTVVTRGQAMLVDARAWRTSSGERLAVPGASVRWVSADPRIAVVAGEDDGTALITGVSGGRTEIRAVAVDFEAAEPGVLTIRVANTIEIDSVRPPQVRYGEQVTLYGVGFERIDRVVLGDAELIVDRGSLLGAGSGAEQLRAWVPFPAPSGRVAAIATQGFSAPAQDSTKVVPLDLYDDDSVPTPVFELDGPPILGRDTLLFLPGLALVGTEHLDRYRLVRADTTRPLSIIVETAPPVVTFFNPVVSLNEMVPLDEDWSISVADYLCRATPDNLVKPYPANAAARVVRAFTRAPASAMVVDVSGDPPGRYSITVLDRYVTADPRIPPDRFEENDYCNAADRNAQDPARHIDLTQPFADTLTIDNPYDLDWIRFTVPGDPDAGVPVPITIRTEARPFGASDSTNLGLHLIDGAFGIKWGQSHQPGSSEEFHFEAVPGDWYVLVADEAGIPTRYGLCIAAAATCSFIPEPSGARSEPSGR
jgi:hypothetical protein